MINILIANGVEVRQAERSFEAGDGEYSEGTYVIKMDQAYRPFVTDILGPQVYPDWRQYPGGPPERTFDLTGWTLPYQMGVEVIKSDSLFEAQLRSIQGTEPPSGKVSGDGSHFILDHNVLDSYRAVNRLLNKEVILGWAAESFFSGGKHHLAGAILVSSPGIRKKLESLAEEFHLQIQAVDPPDEIMLLKLLRLGLYKSWVANKDEGWTRWIFDTWEFPYTTIHDADIKSGNLFRTYDVIVLPNISSEEIINGYEEGRVPAPYTGGIGEQGLTALDQFVKDGGTLITLNASCELALDHFNLPLTNVAQKYPSTEFFCPSAILNIHLELTHPITYGMGEIANVIYFGSPLLSLTEPDETVSEGKAKTTSELTVIGHYPKEKTFMSGRLIGDHFLHGKPALIEVDHGKCKIILFAFRPKNRAQPHGTFMLFFNSLYYGPAMKTISKVE